MTFLCGLHEVCTYICQAGIFIDKKELKNSYNRERRTTKEERRTKNKEQRTKNKEQRTV